MTETKAPNPFGAWLDETLKAKRLTVSELSERAKVSRGTIYHYLRGRRLPNQEELARISTALGVAETDVPRIERKRVGRPPANLEEMAA